MKKLLAMLLLLTLMLPLLISCGGSPADTGSANTGDDTGSSSADTEPEEEKPTISDATYDGYEYTILLSGNVDYAPINANDFYFEEDTKDNISRGKMKWLKDAEQKFDITFNIVDQLKWGGASGTGLGYKAVNEDYVSGDRIYDSCMIGTYDVANLARNGLLSDLAEYPYIDLSHSWWDQIANQDLGIQKRMFYTTGDISLVDNIYTHCVLFNKDLIKQKNLQNPYELVDADNWNMDTFSTLVKQGSDTAGEGMAESSKEYGLMTWNDAWINIMAAADERLCSVDDSGTLKFTMYNERSQMMYDLWSQLALDKTYVLNYQTGHATGEWDPLRDEVFNGNRALFYMNLFSTVPRHRDSETDFGILPFPKLNKDQERYGHIISAYHAEFFCVPVFVEDEDMTGSVSEYMAYTGQRITKPAYYDATLIGQQVRDDESVGMLDIIFASRVYDVGSYYKIGNISTRIGQLPSNPTQSFQQIYNENAQMAEITIRTINEAYKKTTDATSD